LSVQRGEKPPGVEEKEALSALFGLFGIFRNVAATVANHAFFVAHLPWSFQLWAGARPAAFP
jgi:hypothetical protein